MEWPGLCWGTPGTGPREPPGATVSRAGPAASRSHGVPEGWPCAVPTRPLRRHVRASPGAGVGLSRTLPSYVLPHLSGDGEAPGSRQEGLQRTQQALPVSRCRQSQGRGECARARFLSPAPRTVTRPRRHHQPDGTPPGWPTPGTLSGCGQGVSERTTLSDPCHFLILAGCREGAAEAPAGRASEYLQAGGADRWGLGPSARENLGTPVPTESAGGQRLEVQGPSAAPAGPLTTLGLSSARFSPGCQSRRSGPGPHALGDFLGVLRSLTLGVFAGLGGGRYKAPGSLASRGAWAEGWCGLRKDNWGKGGTSLVTG